MEGLADLSVVDRGRVLQGGRVDPRCTSDRIRGSISGGDRSHSYINMIAYNLAVQLALADQGDRAV